MPAIGALVPDIPVRGLLGCRVLLRCSTGSRSAPNDLTQLTLGVDRDSEIVASSVPRTIAAVREAEAKVASRAAA